jgi:hypothetical protein
VDSVGLGLRHTLSVRQPCVQMQVSGVTHEALTVGPVGASAEAPVLERSSLPATSENVRQRQTAPGWTRGGKLVGRERAVGVISSSGTSIFQRRSSTAWQDARDGAVSPRAQGSVVEYRDVCRRRGYGQI